MVLVQPLWKTAGQYLLKLGIPLPGISPREMRTCVPQMTWTRIIAILLYQKVGTIQISINRRVSKQLWWRYTLECHRAGHIIQYFTYMEFRNNKTINGLGNQVVVTFEGISTGGGMREPA